MATSRKDLPGWRLPHGAIDTERIVRETERAGIAEAIYDLVGADPMSGAELAELVREHWGAASGQAIARQLRELVRAGAITRVAGGYVRREAP